MGTSFYQLCLNDGPSIEFTFFSIPGKKYQFGVCILKGALYFQKLNLSEFYPNDFFEGFLECYII